MNSQEQLIHFSIGSATKSIHLSTDIAPDDPQLLEKIDTFTELWMKCHIRVEQLQRRIGE